MHRLSIRHGELNTELGHLPDRMPICRHDGTEMVLRSSRLNSSQMSDGNTLLTNGFTYKCPDCDWVKMYEIACKEEHFMRILGLRKNKPHYHPSLEKFKENELVKQKLESLGYF